MAGGVSVFAIAGSAAAQIAGEDHMMDAVADRALRAAKRFAAQHVDSGEYISLLGTERTPSLRPSRVGMISDRLVYSDHPASTSIEYGHWKDHESQFIYRTGSRRVSTGVLRRVPGQFILTRSMRAA